MRFPSIEHANSRTQRIALLQGQITLPRESADNKVVFFFGLTIPDTDTHVCTYIFRMLNLLAHATHAYVMCAFACWGCSSVVYNELPVSIFTFVLQMENAYLMVQVHYTHTDCTDGILRIIGGCVFFYTVRKEFVTHAFVTRQRDARFVRSWRELRVHTVTFHPLETSGFWFFQGDVDSYTVLSSDSENITVDRPKIAYLYNIVLVQQ